MTDLLYRMIAFIVAKLLANKDLFWAAIAKGLAYLKGLAEVTGTQLDDLVVAVLEAAATDEEVRALVDSILDQLLTLANADVPRGSVGDDPLTVAHAKVLAGKLNIDWAKLLEILMKLLPFILPLLKPTPEGEAA